MGFDVLPNRFPMRGMLLSSGTLVFESVVLILNHSAEKHGLAALYGNLVARLRWLIGGFVFAAAAPGTLSS